MTQITISQLLKYKQNKQKFATLTAYDASFSALFFSCGIEVMLVGDSLGMTLQGHDSTLPVTIEDIAYHTRSVKRGAPECFLMADMPFMSYATVSSAYENAAILMRAGANMVKLEGGAFLVETVMGLTQRSVPVCAHLGLTPQAVNVIGGYKIQGRDETSAAKLIQEAIALQNAGAQMLVLECVPTLLAKEVTEKLSIPVIGIGAGKYTDGQILVMHDALGITQGKIPKFAKNFLNESKDIASAIKLYKSEVEAEVYPAEIHSFN
ncbi:3-methyl-2-oxobutanoate hydroxymethyltransferase [Thorsellia kenyensis]|uniref:3-methyl-2-oxobutanoate hydroxymethyltransferase n=1 Tax=Thorsellia kenyensis TaxID=1549888 RepID=A0ABV6CBA0_9GAMM